MPPPSQPGTNPTPAATSRGGDGVLPGVVDDVAEGAPQQGDEDRRADEAEPERRGDAPVPGEDPADRRADEHPADDADHVDRADPPLELLGHRTLPHRRRGG